MIQDEDYVPAASSQVGTNSGVAITVGRNESALHHYLNTCREAFEMESLPSIEG